MRMTFCGYPCERKANGATIEDMLAVERFPWSEILGEVAGKDIAS